MKPLRFRHAVLAAALSRVVRSLVIAAQLPLPPKADWVGVVPPSLVKHFAPHVIGLGAKRSPCTSAGEALARHMAGAGVGSCWAEAPELAETTMNRQLVTMVRGLIISLVPFWAQLGRAHSI